MSFSLQGFVLKPSRASSSNSRTTGETNSTVSHEHIYPQDMIDLGYQIIPNVPVEPYADMYTACVLDGDIEIQTYAVFANTNSQFSDLDTTEIEAIDNVTTLGTDLDFYTTFRVTEPNNRTFNSINSVQVVRGDNFTTVTCTFGTVNTTTGIVTLDSASITNLGGGFSKDRGDLFFSSFYTLSRPKFYWSRNDTLRTRFYWDGNTSKWTPLKGSNVANIGQILRDQEYKLFPPLTGLVSGMPLPIDLTNQDSFCFLRYGLYGDATGTPLNTLVVNDDLVDANEWRSDLGWDTYDSVIGVSNSVLLLNPTFIDTNTGLNLWFNTNSFSEDNNGNMGALQDLDRLTNINHYVLSPIPLPTEHPLIKIGNRTYLEAIQVDDDSALPLPTSIPSGVVYWSRTTGKLSLSSVDIAKSQPSQAEYTKSRLLASVYYDGVMLTSKPVPLRLPTPVLNEDGDFVDGNVTIQKGEYYLPRSLPLPPPGVSGVKLTRDTSGDYPNTTTTPQTRANGSGLVRSIKQGDSFFFNETKRYTKTQVTEYDSGLESNFKVNGDSVQVSRMVGLNQPTGYTDTSTIKFKRKQVKDQPFYFIQSNLVLASYQDQPRLYSKKQEPYVLNGNESIVINVDGVTSTINTSSLFPNSYSAEELATLLNFIVPNQPFRSFRGYLYIQGNGSVEIGYNTDVFDLSGHTVLGFLPTWRVDTNTQDMRWLADSGVSLDMYRSPVNLDDLNGDTDSRAYWVLEDSVIEKNINSFPFQAVDQFPLEDIPGYDQDIHFQVVLGGLPINMPNYGSNANVGVIYDYEESRLVWTELGKTNATQVLELTPKLSLDNFDIVPQTLSSLTMQDIEFGLYYKPVGGSATELTIGEDFLLEDGGSSGTVSLIQKVAPSKYNGSGGVGIGNKFSNPIFSTDTTQNNNLQWDMFTNTRAGNLLEIQTGDSKGVYRIINVSLIANLCVFDVTPSFPFDFASDTWKVYDTEQLDQLDESLLIDVKGIEKQPFQEEPIKIKVLSPSGTKDTSIIVNTSKISKTLRPIKARFGLGGTDLPIYILEKGVDLGLVRPQNLVYPNTTSPYFTESNVAAIYFQFRIGDNTYNSTNGLLTWDGSSDPNKINIVSATSEIVIGENLLATNQGDTVYLDELFRMSSNLDNETELRLSDGVLNAPSSIDSTTECYLVLEQILANNFDAKVSPLNGGIYLTNPLMKNDIVEVSYTLADDYGDKAVDESGQPIEVTEFLSHIVKQESAVRVDDFLYSFNQDSKALDENFQVSVWVANRLYGLWDNNYSIDYENNLIVFNVPIDSSAQVFINYAMLPALGGEQTFSTSQAPLYKKPLLLPKGDTSFNLVGDRTQDFPINHVLAIGATPFYITSVSYDSVNNVTVVDVFPPQDFDVGSNSPNNDEELLVSDFSVRTNLGYMASLNANYLPIDKGNNSLLIQGDFRLFLRADHILEIQGYPFIISGSTLTEDGSYTLVTLGSRVQQNFTGGSLRVSLRPMAFDLLRFQFKYLPVLSEGVDLLVVSDNIGRALTQGVDFTLSSSGALTLSTPLKEFEYLYASYTRYRQVQPTVQESAEFYPEYYAQHLVFSEPNKQNRIENARLKGSYTFYSPDSFSFQVQPLQDYVLTVVDEILNNTASNTSGVSQANNCQDTSAQGDLGLYGENSDLANKDRVSRVYIEFYNKVIVGFEQVLETINGKQIGDRDGKFRFDIGHGRKYPPQGFEDSISGKINPRLIWRSILEDWAEDLQGAYFKEIDPIIDPPTGTETDPVNKPNRLDGKTPNVRTLTEFINLQKEKIRNDMDDRVLIGFARSRGFAAIFPKLDVLGVFKSMAEPSALSRLFPSETKHFSRLYPGLGATVDENNFIENGGYYSPGRTIVVEGDTPRSISKEKVSTRNAPIGTISNPALGVVGGIVDVNVEKRYARSRVWAYYPNGNEDLDNAFGIITTGVATILATPLYLSDLPLDTETGFPDFTKFLSFGGSLIDLLTGDNELSTPPFEIGDRIVWGNPNGSLFDLITGTSGLYVGEVLNGCVVTLVDKDGNSVSGDDIIVSDSQSLADIASPNNAFGDTILATAPKDFDNVPASDESATVEELEELIVTIPDYRIDNDIKLDKTSGILKDATLPNSDDDGIPTRGIFGQNPPPPLTPIQGIVNFQYTSPNPAQLPCLLGQPRDDSGDVAVPYIKSNTTELDILGNISNVMGLLLDDTAYSPKPSDTAYSVGYPNPIDYQYWDSVLPDEIRVIDGTYYASQDGTHSPSVLYTTEDLRPIDSTGQYQSRSGIGSVRRYDLGFVQFNQANLPQPLFEGIVTVGDIENGNVELPRYIHPTTIGDRHKYHLKGAYSHKGQSTTGVFITETVVGVDRTTIFEFNSVSGLNLQGLFNLFFNTNNVFNINLFEGNGGYVGSLTFDQVLAGNLFWTYDTVGAVVPHILTALMSFTGTTTFSVETNISSVGPLQVLGLAANTYYDFTIDLDTYITSDTNTLTGGALTVSGGLGSTTCQIQDDRLTFSELIDLSTVSPRNTFPFNGDTNYEMGAQLDVIQSEYLFTDYTVNGKGEINGGSYLSYLERVGPDKDGVVPSGQPYVATTDSGGRGRLRAMAWEYHNNSDWGVSDVSSVKLSLAPSSDLGTSVSTRILSSSGLIQDNGPYGGYSRLGSFTWIYSVAENDLSSVQSGDIVILDSKVTNGTSLVRHTVSHNGELDGLGRKARGVKPKIVAGTGDKIDLTFPTLSDFDSDTETITLSGVKPVLDTPNGSGFDTTTTFYFIRESAYATFDSSYDLEDDSVYSCQGTISYDSNTETATITGLGTYRDASGSILFKSTFFNGLSKGQIVSGMVYFTVKQLDASLPKNNCVGCLSHQATGNDIQGGFQFITLTNSQTFHATSPFLTFSSGAGTIVNQIGTPPPSSIEINIPIPNTPVSFIENPYTPVLGRMTKTVSTQTDGIQGVATYVSLKELTASDWDSIHFDGGAPTNKLDCLLPFDTLVLSNQVDPSLGEYGFIALGGVFCEPSFPKTTSLGLIGYDSQPRVVTNSFGGVSPNTIGFRLISSYTNPLKNSETVNFIVRRIRRFHDQQQQIVNLGTDLPYVYEMRYGEISSVTPKTLTAVDGTQLGGFTDTKVNILSGDVVRFFDNNGNLKETNEIAKVLDDNTLRLKYPLMFTYSGGERFEVFLKNNISPIEQSCQELFESVTQEIVFERTVPRANSNEDGGFVSDFNQLQDTLVSDWQAQGVLENDYVVINPQGTLYTSSEQGARPNGDVGLTDGGQDKVGVSVDGVVNVFSASKPNVTDDNRGFYKVGSFDSATPNVLPVTGSSLFCGSGEDGGDDVIFGDIEDYGLGLDYRYVVLPTVSDSSITNDGREGQQSLRPTARPISDQYNLRTGVDIFKSIEPFSYKIVRPVSLLSSDTVELVLFMRERMLSWIEELRSFYNGDRGGDYYVFQRDDHLLDIGSPIDPSVGLGIFPNLYITDIMGLSDIAPFSNNNDCLSILDRRFWVLDITLDNTSPVGVSENYTSFEEGVGSQRPVLPDYIDDTLSFDDDLRGQRYSWIVARSNVFSGTLQESKRVNDRLKSEIEKQQQLAKQQKNSKGGANTPCQ